MSQLCFEGSRSLGNSWKKLPCLPYALCLSSQDTLSSWLSISLSPDHHIYYPNLWLKNSQSATMLQKHEDIYHLAAFKRHWAIRGVMFLIFFWTISMEFSQKRCWEVPTIVSQTTTLIASGSAGFTQRHHLICDWAIESGPNFIFRQNKKQCFYKLSCVSFSCLWYSVLCAHVIPLESTYAVC